MWMSRRVVPSVIALLMAAEMVLGTALALAQAPNGPFAQLSPGNRRIAQALFEAQDGPVPLTLDQIAARRLERQGWGDVFQGMRAEGRLQARSIGDVMSAYNQRHPGEPDRRPSVTPVERGVGRPAAPVRGPGHADDATAAQPGRGGGRGR
jgi:hypothetical protein